MASFNDCKISTKFQLNASFINKYKDRVPPFGFNGLGELVYRRTYSRVKPNGENEVWYETIERVVNGIYNMQKNWIEMRNLGWNDEQAQESAHEMYDRMYNLKFSAPGRGYWACGSPITEERGLFAALNNCAFVSTAELAKSVSKPFCFLMDMSMLGVGVGFDTRGSGTVLIKGCNKNIEGTPFKVPDSREGWVECLRQTIEACFNGNAVPQFDYSLIRAAGTPIKGFGGVCNGYKDLQTLVRNIISITDKNAGLPITITTIVNICNVIGLCVVSGNVRRTAEISLGPETEEFLDLKNYKLHPERAEYGWTSNNSVFAELGMNYENICKRIVENGEPGLVFLSNMQRYSRMGDLPDDKDRRAMGSNPCNEQTLEPYELCCLVECFPARHESLLDFKRTLKFAYLYAKTVTLGETHWPETNRVMLRNRRIGCSLSGIAQFIAKNGLEHLRIWCEEGYETIQRYDKIYSDWLTIPRSIKTTSIKPSGSVSLLAGATAGMHYPESRFCIRRIRLSKHSDLLPMLTKMGLPVEPDVAHPNDTMVVEFPIDYGQGVRTLRDVSMFEQLCLAAFLQKCWADNQVSCTVTFDPEHEGKHLVPALDYFQYQLKGISFLPRVAEGAYAQMPIEAITEERYNEMTKAVRSFNFSETQDHETERFCDGDTCMLKTCV